jgi:hypothetical protein
LRFPSLQDSEMQMVAMGDNESIQTEQPKIYGVKIVQDGDKCYCISVRHTGEFRLADYRELEFGVSSVRLVKR